MTNINEFKIGNGGKKCRDFKETSHKYCVYGERADQWNTCTGEIGSPLVFNNTINQKWSIYGVASSFIDGKQSDCFVPRFYTSIPDSMGWIVTNLI